MDSGNKEAEMAIFTVKICISHCATSAYADIYGKANRRLRK